MSCKLEYSSWRAEDPARISATDLPPQVFGQTQVMLRADGAAEIGRIFVSEILNLRQGCRSHLASQGLELEYPPPPRTSGFHLLWVFLPLLPYYQ
jgi:hypothetical protein